MKKLLAILLALAMCLSLAACSNGGDTTTSDATTDDAATSDATADTTASDEPLTIEDVWPAGTTVYIDVPAKAGGGTDLYTRYLTQAWTELYPDVNFVVTNYDTTEVGRENAKNADPDGTHFLVHHAGACLEYLSGSTNVNSMEDYATVGVINLGGPQAIIARPDAPYHNFAELGEYIAAHPGEVVIGCSLGGASQAAIYSVIEGLGEGYGDMVNWVQCSSEADKLTQTASGSIDIANCSIPNAQGYEADGRLTILGTVGPEVSTLETMDELLGTELPENYASGPEQGIPDATFECSYYLWAPKDTPENICRAVNEAVCAACDVQSYIDGNKAMATFVEPVDYDTAQETFQREWGIMETRAEQMGIKVR